MGIQYVFAGTEDTIHPVIVCDVCCKPITDFHQGNVDWEAPPSDWDYTELSVNRVFFTHKACDHTLRQWLRQEGITTYWEELRNFPIHLMYTSGMRPLAMAAWEAREKSKDHDLAGKSGLSLRFSILKRDKYRCQLCGRGAKDGIVLEVDHKIAKARGGIDIPENLWTRCFDCNRGKSDDSL